MVISLTLQDTSDEETEEDEEDEEKDSEEDVEDGDNYVDDGHRGSVYDEFEADFGDLRDEEGEDEGAEVQSTCSFVFCATSNVGSEPNTHVVHVPAMSNPFSDTNRRISSE